MIAEPMTYHFPGWNIETTKRHYQLWAPGEITHDGEPTGQTRDHWAAGWTADAGMRGDFVQGETREDVLRIFPTVVRAAFRRVDTERPCASCGGRCDWCADQWVCIKCGDEWSTDHGPSYAYGVA